MRYADIWPRYAKFWNEMTIEPDRVAEFTKYAQYAVKFKSIYQKVETATGVPWYMCAVIHRREGNSEFDTYLGNGQVLWKVTTEVPAGRGPFISIADQHNYDMLIDAFVRGAVDAVKVEGWGTISQWVIEKILYYCMLFNGAGYESIGLPSPYVWGGTNIQKPGKFIRDHVFSRTTMDTQPGCAPMIQMIAKLDPTVTFTRET